ncbi:hypothetical protein SeLEV6574_g06012 [Synchytrium endobioticum]|uniref:Uncharacterized protein n=1 Tax=Synchytrium endobioticum TaxID=286115 RepID=A0A507CR83_9FUNG|nr:hypothetical protein SeLEV6574_g06012 [Synchytrium endobioticum]
MTGFLRMSTSTSSRLSSPSGSPSSPSLLDANHRLNHEHIDDDVEASASARASASDRDTTPDIMASSPTPIMVASSTSSSIYTQNQPHLILQMVASFLPVIDQSQVFFDSAGGHIVTTRDGEVDVIGIGRGWDPKRIRIPVRGYTRSVKLSPDGTFLGVIPSAKSLQVVRVAPSPSTSPIVYEIVRDSRSSDAILGFEWTVHEEFVCITSIGLDFLQWNETKRTFIKRKSIHLNVNWYIYSPSYRILIVATGAPGLYMFYVRPNGLTTQLPFLIIPSAAAPALSWGIAASPPNPMTRKQLSIVMLYGKIYVVYHDLSKEPTLALYHVTKSSVRRERELKLRVPGNYIVNVVDNLLIVHNLAAKNSMIFDIQSSDDTPLAPSQPMDLDTTEAIDLYPDDAIPYQPSALLLPSRGTLYSIYPRLADIAGYLIQHDANPVTVVMMLLRRADKEAHDLVLMLLRTLIVKTQSVEHLRAVFDAVNHATVSAIKRRPRSSATSRERSHSLSSTGSAMTPTEARAESPMPSRTSLASQPASHSFDSKEFPVVISQKDIYTHVFLPLLNDPAITASQLYPHILSYFASLSLQSRTPAPYLCELLTRLLIRCRRFAQLQQLIQYHVIADSAALGRMLMENEDARALKQVGLDMLKRVGAGGDVVDALVGSGKVLEALRYASATNILSQIPPVPILESAYASGDRTLFLNAFRCFEEAGLIPQQSASSSLGRPRNVYGDGADASLVGALNRYVSMFYEVWGQHIEMERVIQ